MSFSRIYSVQNNLLKAQIIDVECDISRGMNSFNIVGLGDKAIDEAKDRISSAIKNSGFNSPKKDQIKTTISLAPAHIKKVGPIFDLAMALCFLKSSKQINFCNKDKIFIGELSLDGNIRKIAGVLPMVVESKKKGFKEIYLPKDNVVEASLVSGVDIFPCESLLQVINHLDININGEKIEPQKKTSIDDFFKKEDQILIEHIKGNENAKRAIVISLAGGHNICFYGPPGTGKTMLARASKSLLPRLSFKEILDITSLYSISGGLDNKIITTPPFRSPHHTSSYVSIVGGGTDIRPGEISLAHKGVLFLDEFPEFDNRVINSLRQPLEEGEVKISRAKDSALLPADFMLIISMNPCPCGFYGYDSKNCTCTLSQVSRYQKKISGPIMDRIDIWVEVSLVDYEKLVEQKSKDLYLDNSLTIKYREEIKSARSFQFKNSSEKIGDKKLNGSLSTNQLEKILVFDSGVKEFFDQSAKKLCLSARSYTRILKVALTISQISGSNKIKKEHLLEALSWRPNDKFFV